MKNKKSKDEYIMPLSIDFDKSLKNQEMDDNEILDIRYCVNCGSKLLENSRFCVKCGHEIYHVEPKKKEKDSVIFGIISFLCSMFLLLAIAVPICSKNSGIDKSLSKVLGTFLYVVLSILPLIMGIIGIVSGVGKLNGKDKKNNKGGLVLSIISMVMLFLGFILLTAN